MQAMKLRRFRVDQIGELARIEGDQAHHAGTVLRLSTGDEVCVFDGTGREATGHIETVGRDWLTVRITARKQVVEPDGPRLTIVAAAPKGDRADWMIEKCAELGVEELIPLHCAHGQIVPGDGKLKRWRRKADEAAKQSGQAATMRVASPRELEGAIAEAAKRGPSFFGDPRCDAPSFPAALAKLMTPMPQSLTVFIGPEGGFAEDETRDLEAGGAGPVRLASPILRIETAAVAAAGCWAAWLLDAFPMRHFP